MLIKKVLDAFCLDTQEGHIIQAFFQGLTGPFEKPVAFDVDTYEVNSGIGFCQAIGIFSFSASDFQNDGMVVSKIGLVPLPTKVKITDRVLVFRLDHIGECIDLRKLLQFTLGHRNENINSALAMQDPGLRVYIFFNLLQHPFGFSQIGVMTITDPVIVESGGHEHVGHGGALIPE